MTLAGSIALLPVVFATHGGWHTGHDRAHACPGVSASRCVSVESWAATVPWRDCAACVPHKTIASMPPDGIALQVFVAVEHPLVAKRTLAWPPRIRGGDVGGGMEGVSSRYGVYQRFARVDSREVYVWAFFGRAHPTRAQLARANAELATTHL